jgi:hypothetical protein
MEETIRAVQAEFDTAELQADRTALQRLLTDDFLSIGPKGFLLTKQEWIDRHGHFRYHALEISEVDVRLYDHTAIVRNVQRNHATYKDQDIQIAVRVSQTWVDQGGHWQLAGIQFSPLAEQRQP